MKTFFFRYFLIVSLFVISGESCKKQIEVGAPVTKLVTTSVFADNGTATSAMLAIYAQMSRQFMNYSLHRFTGLSSDELFSYSTDLTTKNTYTNALNVTNDASSLPWRQAYNLIYQANAIIENLQASTTLNARVAKQLLGESQFIRAYWHFYLVNLYGDIPLITSTDYSTNAALGKTAKAQVYQQIVADLKSAQSNLSTKWVDASDTVSISDRVRPTVWAASALLARTYLYMGAGSYPDAETEATKIISNSSLFYFPSDINMVFKKTSTEAIWQLGVYSGTSGFPSTYDGINFILTAPPSSGNVNCYTISPQLMAAFEPNDLRKSNWTNTFSNSTGSWTYPYKYKDSKSASVNTEYDMVFRLAEQYLIRAEARAQQGKLTSSGSAIEDLNIIRNRAGVGNYLGPTDQASVIAAISHERQVELFLEGDRWLNLKRTGTVDAVMGGPSGVCFAKGGIWNSNAQLYPILLSDVQNNANLPQNPGY